MNTTIVRASAATYTDRELNSLWDIGEKDADRFCYYSGAKIDDIPMLIQATRHVHKRAEERDFKTPATEIVLMLVQLLEKYPDAAQVLLDIEEGRCCIFFKETGQVFFVNIFPDKIQINTYLAFRSDSKIYTGKDDHTLCIFKNGTFLFDDENGTANFKVKDPLIVEE